MLLLCSSQMYWAVSVMSVPNLARVHVERVESFFSFFSPSSNCVPATNLCLFSVELVNVHGFLFIILAASTA